MLSDLRFTLRSLKKVPVLVSVVVLSLTVGIGANATVLCWLRNILLNPLPGVAMQSRLVVLKSNNGGGNISYSDSKDLASMKEVFEDGAVSQLGPVYLEADERKDWIYGQITSANFFDVLGVKPILGRTFLPDEDKSYGGNPIMVIGELLWRKRFNADPDIIGRKVLINRHPITIIGVVPEEFKGTMTGLNLEYWAPLSMRKEFYQYGRDYVDWRGSRPWHNLFRLKPGVSRDQAQAAVNTMDARLQKEYPRSNERAAHQVLPLSQSPNGAQNLMIPALTLMLCLSFMVLLIVGANVANLLLARTIKRGKEIAIRLATGASRFHLVRLIMMESLLLGTAGGIGGLLLASWMVNLLQYMVPAADLPVGALAYRLDPLTVAATLALTLVTSLLVGFIPVFQASRAQLNDALKEGGRSSSGSSHHFVRNSLVVSEVALSIVLLVCAVLCIKGFRRSESMNPGFETKGVLLAKLSIGMQGYDEARGIEFYSRLHSSLSSTPGVLQASLASFFPLGFEGCKGTDAQVRGREVPKGEDGTYERTLVSPGFFATFRQPLIAGRDFADSDDSKAPLAVIVNEVVAERFWPGQDPIGRVLRSSGRDRTVVGLVKSVKFYRMDEKPRPHLYFPYRQGVSELDMGICLKVEGDPRAFATILMKKVQELDPGVDVRRIMTMNDHAMASRFASQAAAAMLLMMGVVALCLASMGIYAVMVYSVNQRTQEFGVRMALGASAASIIGMVLRQGLLLSALGTSIGLLLAGMAGQGLSSFLYGVSPFDPLAFVGVPLLLAAIAMLACWAPAFKASRVDPSLALRAD